MLIKANELVVPFAVNLLAPLVTLFDISSEIGDEMEMSISNDENNVAELLESVSLLRGVVLFSILDMVVYISKEG